MLQWEYQLLQLCYHHTELFNTKLSYKIPEAMFSLGHQAKNNPFGSLQSQTYKNMKTDSRSTSFLAKILIFFFT